MRISDWSSDVCSSDLTSRWEPSFPHCDFGCLFQLGHEAIIFLARPISVPDPQKIDWMHSHPSLRPVGQLLNLATQFSNRAGMTETCPSSRCSKRNGQRGTVDRPLLVQPPSDRKSVVSGKSVIGCVDLKG